MEKRKVSKKDRQEIEAEYDYSPSEQKDLFVLAQSGDLIILKDKVSNHIYAVERRLNGEVFLNRIMKGD